MKTFVYIDGFNLYYNCFQGLRNVSRRHLRWLDIRRLAEAALPDDTVIEVNYYTAMVGDTPDDLTRNSRQLAYILALEAHAAVLIHRGHMQKSKREGRLTRPVAGLSSWQTVEIRQEKGSDVALASHLLRDAFQDRFELALLITNDPDYAEPVRIVTKDLGKHVGVLSPDINVSKHLSRFATFARPLDLGLLESCQLPDEIERSGKVPLTRPLAWRQEREPV